MPLADFEHRVLDRLGRRVRRQRRQSGGQILQRLALERFGLAELFLGPDEVVIIGNGVLDEAGQQRLVVRAWRPGYSGG